MAVRARLGSGGRPLGGGKNVNRAVPKGLEEFEAVHAFRGEALKLIGAGMAHLDAVRQAQGLPPLPFGAALHLGEILWGNIGAANRLDFTAIGPRSTW